MSSLDDYRIELDKINADILLLHEKRLQLVEKVADYKTERNLPIFQPDREKEIIETMCAKVNPEDAGGVKLLFDMIMRISREYQYNGIYQNSSFYKKLQKFKETSAALPSSPKIACPGVPGSYSSQCAHDLFENVCPTYYETFKDVCDAVSDGKADIGILPIENSNSGSILQVFDLMIKNDFYIYKSHKVRVQHYLLGQPNASLENITDIYSHEQGIHQCSDFLSEHKNMKTHTYSNTAAAAKFVCEKNDGSCAAIASKECSELYDLSVIKPNIQNMEDNYTRFIVITKEFYKTPEANKISVFLSLPNEIGSLYGILARFAICGLNLTKLESRPMDSKFSYLFFLEFEGNIFHQNVEKLLCQLSEELEHFAFLGNYYDDNHIYE